MFLIIQLIYYLDPFYTSQTHWRFFFILFYYQLAIVSAGKNYIIQFYPIMLLISHFKRKAPRNKLKVSVGGGMG